MEEEVKKPESDIPEEEELHSSWREQAQKSLWMFLTVAAIIIFYYVIQQLGAITGFIGKILAGISPVIWGLILAYLLAPVAQLYEKLLTKLCDKQGWNSPKRQKHLRTLSAVGMLITAILFITALLLLIIPELMSSITGIVKALPDQMENLTTQLRNKTIFNNNSVVGEYLNSALLSAVQSAEDWVFGDLIGQANTLVQYFYTGVKGVLNVVYNLVIGLILSTYITIDRERLMRQVKQVVYTIAPRRSADSAQVVFIRANRKLNAAIRGKIVDSFIIGCLHFMLLTFANLLPWFNYPYPVLLAVIVGLTNVVPFFGPICGGFITGVLVLFENPRMVIPYLVIVVALQQFDSSFLDPHIVGGKIGLRPVWSITACLLGSAILGVPGFVLGPPAVAVVYEIVSEWSASRLRRKGLNHDFGISDEPEPWESTYQRPPSEKSQFLSGFMQNFRDKASHILPKKPPEDKP